MKIQFQNIMLQKAFDRITQDGNAPSVEDVKTLLLKAQEEGVSEEDRTSLNHALNRSNDAFTSKSTSSKNISDFIEVQIARKASGQKAHALRSQTSPTNESWFANLQLPEITNEGLSPTLTTQSALKLISQHAEYREETLRVKGEVALIEPDRMQLFLEK